MPAESVNVYRVAYNVWAAMETRNLTELGSFTFAKIDFPTSFTFDCPKNGILLKTFQRVNFVDAQHALLSKFNFCKSASGQDVSLVHETSTSEWSHHRFRLLTAQTVLFSEV